MSRLAIAGAGVTAAALAAVLITGGHKVVMPTRRPEFEPGFDFNDMLADAGRHAERKARKTERKDRLKAAQRHAMEGRS